METNKRTDINNSETPRMINRVEGSENAPSFDAKTPSPGNKEGIEEYREQAEQLVASYRKFFVTLAGDNTLEYKISNAFYIDYQRGQIHMDASWLAKKGFTNEQVIWAVCHEIEHFNDLKQDPKGLLENFEYIKTQAKQTGAIIAKKYEEAFGASDPDVVDAVKKAVPSNPKDKNPLNPAEQAAYKIHHTFYNVCDDIYVNNQVARKAVKYEPGEKGGDSVKALYREQLFMEKDYTKIPRHLQFVYALLRPEMVPDEEISITEEVQAALNHQIAFEGAKYTAQEIIDNYIKPRAGRDTTASQRHAVLKSTLEPVFNKLLLKDLEEWKPEKPQDNPEPFAQAYQEYNDNNPDQFSPEQIQEWADNENEKKVKAATETNEEPEKTADERAKEAQQKIDKAWIEKHSVSKEDLDEFRRLEQAVAPYLDELAILWRQIVYGSAQSLNRGMAGHFRTGLELDVARAIEEWPRIESGQFEQVEVMNRMVSKESEVKQPELIRIRLSGDHSGSMNAEKMEILKQAQVLILSSLREFNTYLNLTRSQTKSKLEVDSEVWIFGADAKKVKNFREQNNFDDEQVEMIRVNSKKVDNRNSTNDHLVLEQIQKTLNDEEVEKIKKGTVMEIIFEITDGGSGNPHQTKGYIDQLLQKGVIVRAFQIGKVSEGESQTFKKVWNEGREERLGTVVGPHIERLIPAIAEALKRYLKNVKI